jgi:carbamoylphosphate synthase large subunit
MKPRVLVACSRDWVSPSRLPRVLKKAGCRVTAFCPPGAPLAATRFVDEVVAAPAELPDYIESLKTHLNECRYSWVLITDDPLLDALAARRDEPWLERVLPIRARSPWADALGSKAAFVELAGPAGLPIPDSRLTTTFAGAWHAANEIGFPVMLKKARSFGGHGVRACADALALSAAYDELADGDPLVVQRFVEGPIGNSVVLYDHGRPICWMSAFKVRTYGGPFGPSSARRFMTHPDVLPILEKVGKESGYHGFAAVDWVLDERGRLVILELNTRPVPTIHMGQLAGVDFARALGEILAGAPTVQAPPEPPADAPVYPMFPEDLYRSSSENERSVASWLPRPGRYTDLPWQDPPLLAFHLRRLRRAAREARR